jgi:multicomponent Na+:H+ antiporter subunit E
MMFAANVLLAFIWATMTGALNLINLLVGFVIGYCVLALFTSAGHQSYIRRVWGGATLVVFAVYALVLANLRVAWFTIADLRDLKPAILGVPLRPDLTDGEITLLATLVTLTPGTLTLDLAKDRSVMFIHFMHVDDPARAMNSITEGFERRILRMTR